MELWNYNGLVIALQAALDREDEAQSVRMIKELLKAAATPWEMKNSPLFRHIPVKGVPETYTKHLRIAQNTTSFRAMRNSGS